MSDPRANLPSASSYAITEACAGSENAIRSIPPEAVVKNDAVDEQAERGTRIHACWETGNTLPLSQDELDDYKASIKLLDQAVTDWRASLPEPYNSMPVQEVREQRLWLNNPSTLEPEISGQFDRLYICGPYAMVADLKSGWCRHLLRSEINRQLRVLAVLVWKEYGVTEIVAAFIKPKTWKNKIDSVLYTEADLAQSEALILHSLWKTKQPEAQRVPGTHCTYCRAKSLCPEAAAYSLLPSVMVNKIETPDRRAMIERMTTEDKIAIQSRATVIRNILDDVNKSLKATPEAELARCGWRIGKGKKLDPISKTKEAFDALVNFGVSADELWEALKFGKGDLVKAVMRDQGWAKGPTEGWLWDQILAPMIEKKESEGSLERIE